ncbi:lycopene cyclase domain-containing protein [Dyadobacter luticola]|uniref:Lycopene cyclase domain-containing protein n=1 Tax=Dyadobacter luticola TaxID=1979387 RepID=A0A5R9L4Y2_9BACT|nr:lycopene cyclase domain-containing protein [Dyadobacter luticola]TLV03461.1 lycopene cyclase domain-containing protein [Dyadobacter luticola]
MNYLYLLVDLASISVPLAFSFHPKIALYKHWKAMWPAILMAALPFLIWDAYFTELAVWGFTPRYLTGIYLFNLPIEEVLFFICIPYACLFTYFCFKIWKGPEYRLWSEKIVSVIFILTSAFLAFTNSGRAYTFSATGLLAIFLVYLQFKKPSWLGLFYFSHAFLLVPFFIVNGILTGTGLDEPIVWYNNQENLGIRILTVPVEDVFYGMIMLLLNTSLFEWGLKRTRRTLSPAKVLQ